MIQINMQRFEIPMQRYCHCVPISNKAFDATDHYFFFPPHFNSNPPKDISYLKFTVNSIEFKSLENRGKFPVFYKLWNDIMQKSQADCFSINSVLNYK